MAKESGKKIDRRRATRLLAFLELEVESLNRKNKLGLAENFYLKSLESSKIDRENKRLLDGIFKCGSLSS